MTIRIHRPFAALALALALPALVAGTLACCMTGAVVGLLTPP